MIPALKAELRKVFTVRSTYVCLGIVLALELFFGFYISGWHSSHQDLLNPAILSTDVAGAVGVVSVFVALIAILLMTHEYRYNTVMHTLTLSNSRNKVLLAKVLVVSGLAVVFTLIAGCLALVLSYLGIHANHLKLVHQNIYYSSLLWRCLFFGWGYTLAGLVIAALIRNQIGAIVALFVVPGTIESLLGLVLKHNIVYLPFSALHVVLGQGAATFSGPGITPFHAALVFGAYLLVGWIAAWILFLRRDAN